MADLTARLQLLTTEPDRAKAVLAVPPPSRTAALVRSVSATSADALAVPESELARDRDALLPGRIQSLKRRFEGLGMTPAPANGAARAGTRPDVRRASPDAVSPLPSASATDSASAPPSAISTELLHGALLEVSAGDQAAVVRQLVAAPDVHTQQPIQAAVLVRAVDGLRASGQNERADTMLELYVDAALDQLARQTNDGADLAAPMAIFANALHLAFRYGWHGWPNRVRGRECEQGPGSGCAGHKV